MWNQHWACSNFQSRGSPCLCTVTIKDKDLRTKKNPCFRFRVALSNSGQDNKPADRLSLSEDFLESARDDAACISLRQDTGSTELSWIRPHRVDPARPSHSPQGGLGLLGFSPPRPLLSLSCKGREHPPISVDPKFHI